jgi:hypothetical protein
VPQVHVFPLAKFRNFGKFAKMYSTQRNSTKIRVLREDNHEKNLKRNCPFKSLKKTANLLFLLKVKILPEMYL